MSTEDIFKSEGRRIIFLCMKLRKSTTAKYFIVLLQLLKLLSYQSGAMMLLSSALMKCPYFVSNDTDLSVLTFWPSSAVTLSACSEYLTNETGYFFSPSYPGNLPDDTLCKWHITVEQNHIIRLEFQEFLLTSHPTCEKCFLQIFDGGDESTPVIGKYCGHTYPPVVVSSSEHFTIVLRCAQGLRMARFKASYYSIRSMLYLCEFEF